MSEVFAHMNKLKESGRIVDWEISSGDMEEVFLNVVKQQEEDDELL
jgi:hypothetical protein